MRCIAKHIKWRTLAAGQNQGRVVRGVLIAALVAVLSACLFAVWLAQPGRAISESMTAGMIAVPLLVAAGALAARLRTVIAAFGIEGVIRAHRLVGLVACGVVLLHVLLVALRDSRHLSVFLVWNQPSQVWAGLLAAVALLVLCVLSVLRARLQLRYEGWKLGHVALTVLVLGGTALHLIWLGNGRWVYWVLLAVTLGVVVRRWLVKPLMAYRRSYRVVEVVQGENDVLRLVVQASGHRGFHFQPGQFAWMKIGMSPFVFEDHPFSMASSARNPSRKEFLIKAVGDYTELLSGLRPGRRLYLDGPYGRFTLEKLGQSAGLVFVGGGVGLAPILSMLRTLSDSGYGLPIKLFISTDFVPELESLDLDLEVIATRGLFDVSSDMPVTAEPWHDYYVCGPPALVTAVTTMLKARGISSGRIHTEQFDVFTMPVLEPPVGSVVVAGTHRFEGRSWKRLSVTVCVCATIALGFGLSTYSLLFMH